ncbi:hypothetical protein AKJ09_00548 [Labilithrix luteola]|uniref:Uncharacterized protein n=2 Tax=Labilithrix luteola TaxID=1391654 RepID=A0A0K1PL90_9BACT|nr:hypothetical protein AKJ09_00548 [Labilithrix luteola]
MDTSKVRVTGTFETKEAGAPESVDGSFGVDSLRFYGGGFLDLGLGADRQLGGELENGVLTLDVLASGQRRGRYSLSRVP